MNTNHPDTTAAAIPAARCNAACGSRFAAYFRLYIASNGRKLLLTAATIFAVTFIFLIFNLYTTGLARYQMMVMNPLQGDPTVDSMWSGDTDIMTLILIVTATITGWMLFSAVSSRHGRLQTIELPASQSEKFLTWMIIYLPLMLLACFISFWLADLCRVAWIKAFTDFGDQAHPMSLFNLLTLSGKQNAGLMSSTSWFSVAFTYGFVLCLHASYTLGGILFSRLSYLKTFGCLFLLMNVVSFVIYLGYKVMFDDTANLGMRFDFNDNDATTTWLVVAISVIVSCYMYVLAYARYRELEIIDRW